MTLEASIECTLDQESVSLTGLKVSGKRKLLIVLPASVLGGAEIRTFYLLRSLENFNPVLLTSPDIAGYYHDLGLHIYTLDKLGCGDPYDYSLYSVLRHAWAIKQVANQEHPDIILGMMYNGTFFVSVGCSLLRINSIPVGTILGPVSAYFKYLNRSPSWYEKMLLFYSLNKVAALIVPSYRVGQDIVENFNAKQSRIRTIYNGLDAERIRTAAQLPMMMEKNCFWIVSSCRLSSEKDFPTLLQAFRLVRARLEAKLIIIGDGPLRDNILQIAAEMNIAQQDVILVGFQINPFPYVAKADIFVLSSHFEGFGNVIVEAMILGIPVIASDCPFGPGEIIQDTQNGFLVPVGDSATMAHKILILLKNQDIRNTLIQGGWRRAMDFSMMTMVKAYESEFLKLLTDQ